MRSKPVPHISYVRDALYCVCYKENGHKSPFYPVGGENMVEWSLPLECEVQKNKAKCNCTYESCEKKGKCCECISYHWRMRQLPACFFPTDVERTYDRSIERFIKTHR